MRAPMIHLSLFALCSLVAPVWGRQPSENIPEKAVCRTCEVRGAAHGAEDVAAWREYEGTRYYFCSDDCAEAFDAFPAAYVPHPIPRPAPAATVRTLAGESLALESLRGKVVLLDFWATWCKPCHRLMKTLDALNEEWAGREFTVLGVSIDEKPDDVVPRFIEKKKIRYPVAVDSSPEPAWQAFQVAAIPAMFLIDADGTIVAEWRGKVDEDAVREAVKRLLAESPTAD